MNIVENLFHHQIKCCNADFQKSPKVFSQVSPPLAELLSSVRSASDSKEAQRAEGLPLAKGF